MKKKIISCALACAMAMTMSLAAFAAEEVPYGPGYDGEAAQAEEAAEDASSVITVVTDGWVKTNEGWMFLKDSEPLKGWIDDGTDTFYLDENGIMATGWTAIDGYCYYFSEGLDRPSGVLYVNEYTPDRSKVDASGKKIVNGTKVVVSSENAEDVKEEAASNVYIAHQDDNSGPGAD